jgi:hypothetical protein
MNYQEAEQWASRLRQIWFPTLDVENNWDFSVRWGLFKGQFTFHLHVLEKIALDIKDGRHTLSCRKFAKQTKMMPRVYEAGKIYYDEKSATVASSRALPEMGQSARDFEEFAAKWTPTLRRNCWLAGENIECTTHEKLIWSQWMEAQGVTREELQSWGLEVLGGMANQPTR